VGRSGDKKNRILFFIARAKVRMACMKEVLILIFIFVFGFSWDFVGD